jgi:hypothetical protein
MQTSDLVRMKQLEAENAQMRRIIARTGRDLMRYEEVWT